jgi:amino acid transporter
MAEADPRSSGTYRAALAAVIILSVLLVAGLVAVAAGFVRQYRLYQAHHTEPSTAPGAAASVILAPGAHIVSAATDMGRLVLHVQTREGGEVDVLDLATGQLTAQVKDGPK